MYSTSSSIALSVHCQNIEEAEAAIEAIRKVRQSDRPLQLVLAQNKEPLSELAGRIEVALTKAPLNQTRRIVLEQLLLTAAGNWLPYSELQAVFVKEGFAKEQAQAALRDLSWQMKSFLPEDTAPLAKKIEVLAERSQSGGIVQYKLTAAGRTAVERFLSNSTVAEE